jgi:hypothetical protein
MSLGTTVPTPDARPPREWLTIGMSIALAASVGTNVWLVRHAQKPVPSRALLEGTLVPAFKAVEAGTRRPAAIAYEDTKLHTVLYVTSPSCPWCERNLDSIRALVREKKDAFRFVGLSLSEENLDAQLGDLPFPVYAGVSDAVREVYRLRSTPQTIVVSPQGRVVRTWKGAYVGRTQKEIEGYFQVALPAASMAAHKDS